MHIAVLEHLVANISREDEALTFLGGFGRKSKSDFSAKAAVLARTLGVGNGCASKFTQLHSVVAKAVRRPSSKIAIDKAWGAFDAGTIVNNDRVRSQL